MDTIWLVVGAGAALAVVALAVVFRPRPRVIDTPDPGGSAGSSAAAREAASVKGEEEEAPPTTAGDILARRGADKFLEAFADWVEQTAADDFDTVIEDMTAMTRIADAAQAALPRVLADGRATISLPYLLADASGPKSFEHEFDIADLEEGVVYNALIDARELLRWRGEDARLVALGAWLSAEVEKETGREVDLDEVVLLRVVAAARAAWAAFQRDGRARAELRVPAAEEGGAETPFARDVDAAALAAATRLLKEIDSEE